MKARPDREFVLTGWWLFVASVGLFMAACRAGDPVALAGACAFMAANISFLIPFHRRSSREDHASEE